MPHKDPEKRKAYQIAYRASHQEEIRAYLDKKKVERAAHPKIRNKMTDDERRDRRKAISKKYHENHKELMAAKRLANKEQRSIMGKLYSAAIRNQVLIVYGNKCTCCGETENHFLTIDHINGGGNQHRKILNGRNFYKWLMDNAYPKEFQVLCYNCNMAKGHYGVCPHQLEKEMK